MQKRAVAVEALRSRLVMIRRKIFIFLTSVESDYFRKAEFRHVLYAHYFFYKSKSVVRKVTQKSIFTSVCALLPSIM